MLNKIYLYINIISYMFTEKIQLFYIICDMLHTATDYN